MLEHHVGPALRQGLQPLALRLLSWRISADMVTIAGTVAVVCAATLIACGQLTAGAISVAVFALADVLDGTMARLSGRAAPWGAFLDSTLDRVADAAVFAALVVWFHTESDERGFGLAVAALAAIGLVPYARARAYGTSPMAASAPDGIAARADRLGLTLAAVLAVGLGAPVWVLHLALVILLLGIAATVGQRVLAVRRQLSAPVHPARR